MNKMKPIPQIVRSVEFEDWDVFKEKVIKTKHDWENLLPSKPKSLTL